MRARREARSRRRRRGGRVELAAGRRGRARGEGARSACVRRVGLSWAEQLTRSTGERGQGEGARRRKRRARLAAKSTARPLSPFTSRALSMCQCVLSTTPPSSSTTNQPTATALRRRRRRPRPLHLDPPLVISHEATTTRCSAAIASLRPIKGHRARASHPHHAAAELGLLALPLPEVHLARPSLSAQASCSLPARLSALPVK